MKFKLHQKCWSIENGEIKEHFIQDIGFTSKGDQLIKVKEEWHSSTQFFNKLEKAMDVEEGSSFRMFR